jgi:hypothetical protein
MLTQHEVREQLDAIADEASQPAGVYYELFSRIFSQRVQRWIHTAPQHEAQLIQRIAAEDPDYLPDVDMPLMAHVRQEPLFNPAWDMDY